MSSSDEQPGESPAVPPAASAPVPNGAPLDPRLRGQQASPAPAKEPIPIVPIVLGAGILLTVAILVFNRKGEEPEPAPEPVVAEAVVAEPESKPLVGSERPEIRHAEAWEKSAEALGEIDKHLNRAKLIFEDIDKAMVESVGGQRAMTGGGAGGPPPSGEEAGVAPGGDAGPAPAAAVAPPDQTEAIGIWNRWRGDWERDLEVITGMLPKAGEVDGKLAPGYTAVVELISACRRLPAGLPPSRSARSGWLRGLQNQSVAVRATLEKSR
jgi:hypothetical protein